MQFLKRFAALFGLSRDSQGGRQIFCYWDGAKARSIDPVVAWRGLNSHPQFSFETTPLAVDAGDLDAAKVAVDAVRDVFGIPPWSESVAGLTEWESLALLQSFAAYLASLKKSTDLPPTLPDAMARQFWDDVTTKPSLDSGSTSTEPKPDAASVS